MPNIIITGGGLSNKGAQAMTFICVDEIRKRWPDHKIYVQSTADWQLPDEIKKQYRLEFIRDFGLCALEWKSGGISKLKYMLRGHKPDIAKVDRIYEDTSAMIDVSGYIFGANWADEQVLDFLSRLDYAKLYGFPVYLMPQSFGPFPFTKARARKIEKMARALLPGVKVIFAREQEGYDCLTKRYGLSNVQLSMDMVLNNRSIDPENVFTEAHEFQTPEIAEGSVAIIPNSQNLVYGNEETLLSLYHVMVERLLALDRKVYLMRHSTGDLALCRKIQQFFPENENVILLENDFDCFEMGILLPKFDFAIASRYHSVVHCYKAGTPCLVLGWAVKYHDLMQAFGQEKLFFDVRKTLDNEKVLGMLDMLNKNFKQNRANITEQLTKYQEKNIFDQIEI